MRKIIFRGKREDNGEWVEGFCGQHTDFDAMIIDRPYPTMGGDLAALGFWTVDPETVCQYTGFVDAKGKKIFEGDIIGYTDMYSTENGYSECDCVGKVFWCEEEACFHVTDRLSAESWEVFEDCVVIGNVFDNPDLVD